MPSWHIRPNSKETLKMLNLQESRKRMNSFVGSLNYHSLLRNSHKRKKRRKREPRRSLLRKGPKTDLQKRMKMRLVVIRS